MLARATRPLPTGADRVIVSSSMQAIQREWLRRVEAEYGSAALTHHLTLWLLQITAPFELVRMGLAIVEGDLAHAELNQAVHVAVGGSGMARLERERLGLKLRPGRAARARGGARGARRLLAGRDGRGASVRAHARAHERDYRPRFADFGIDAGAGLEGGAAAPWR